MHVLQELTATFRDVLGDTELVLTRNTTADDVDGWDSVTHVTIVLAVEQKFGLRFRATEIGSLENIGAFADLIEERLKTSA